MMVRTQISMTSEQHEMITRMAAARGVSMSALIREAVDQLVRASATTAAQALLEFADEFQSPGAAAIALDHDNYLAEGEW